MRNMQVVDGGEAPPRRADRDRPGSMLARYVKAAMRHATCAQSTVGEPYHGAIGGLAGLAAQAATYDACQAAL